MCGKNFLQKRTDSKLCSPECVKAERDKRVDDGFFREIGRMGGIISAQIQVRRSKNEIHFAELCAERFENVLTNEPMFDDWDCDVILPDLKIAISYNGIWHYKQVREGHSLKQVESRDMIKDFIIKRHGYQHYIVKDMGSENKKFVRGEFQKFLEAFNL